MSCIAPHVLEEGTYAPQIEKAPASIAGARTPLTLTASVSAAPDEEEREGAAVAFAGPGEAEDPRPSSIINLIAKFSVDVAGERFTARRIRLVGEEYTDREPSEFLVWWAENRALMGHGFTVEEAVEAVEELLLGSFRDLHGTTEDQLTPDAIELKKQLTRLFRAGATE